MMMKIYFLCIFAIVTLPNGEIQCLGNAMAIRCYDCVPGLDDNWCELVSNVTDCDKTPGAPPGEKFDACAKGSYEIEYGGEKKTMKYMSCAVKSLCNTVKEWACNNTLWEKLGITVTKCDLKCCSEDKCNSPDVYLGDTGTSKAASFIPEFLGVATIFVPFFVH